jgi:hypothetical protein
MKKKKDSGKTSRSVLIQIWMNGIAVLILKLETYVPLLLINISERLVYIFKDSIVEKPNV